MRLGTYGPIKSILAGESTQPSLPRNIAAGCMSGALAAVVANPVDLVKTRMQEKGNPHRTSLATIRQVLQSHGVQGLWVGTMPAMVRASVLTATQCATYDEAKKAFKRMTGVQDGLMVQLGAGLMSGLVTTTVTAPVDVVKTNLFACERPCYCITCCCVKGRCALLCEGKLCIRLDTPCLWPMFAWCALSICRGGLAPRPRQH